MKLKKLISVGFVCVGLLAHAEMMDRPSGVRIGQRMVLRPYVAMSATYDSNVESRKNGDGDMSWVINPSLGLEYMAENWELLAAADYSYHAYQHRRTTNEYSYHSYGANAKYHWSNAKAGERGWAVILQGYYRHINQDDTMAEDGRGYGRDRTELHLSGSVQRRITEKLHAAANAQYYWLDYDNDTSSYYPLYGWSRYSFGLEAGYAPSKWTDLIVAGSYQGYSQDNHNNIGGDNYRSIDRNSNGFTVQAGLGSFATERISYRLLMGWSRFEYGGGEATDDGFTYTGACNWKIGTTWNLMLLANSYYQPSECAYGTSTRVDSLSCGIAKSLVRGKLTATFDIAYRREDASYSADGRDWQSDIITGRLGLNYVLNRYLIAFGRLEYQRRWCEGDNVSDEWDYDRFRGTIGLSLTY